MNKPLFSIITISFNSAKTIEKTIQSVLAQTFTDYEYIIVDGASKDSTVDIIKRYEPLFEGKMKWISEPDHGIYNAMNKGIKLSYGEIIGIVNSDDWLENNTLEILADEISKVDNGKPVIMTGETLFHYSDGKTQRFPTSRKIYEHYSKKYRMGLNHPATFVPKQIYDKIGVFDENYKLYADADFVIRCYKNDIPVHFIHKVLSNMSDGGASNTRSTIELKDTLYKYKKHCKNNIEYSFYCVKAYVLWRILCITPKYMLRYYRKINTHSENI